MLIATAVMGFVALGAAGVGTMAWYQADSNASAVKNGTETGNIAVGVSTGSAVNGFTIVPSAITASNTLAYTEVDTGATKVSVYNGSTYDALTGSTSAAKVAAYTLSATINYSGSLNAEASIQALWQQTIANVVVRLRCTEVDNTGEHEPVSGTAATTDIRFTTGASNYGNTGDSQKSLASSNFDFGAPTGSGTYTATTGEVEVGVVYVALTGRDNLVVNTGHLPLYTLTVDVALSA